MKTTVWRACHPDMRPEMLGYIPSFLDEDDPRPAREQFNEKYIGGWTPFRGFTLLPDGNLSYPGDPPMQLLAETTLHNKEVIRFYDCAWVMILQTDGTHEICRMD